jgi:uncharacterized BrkB/YihY/UPF0761 family membrane protein
VPYRKSKAVRDMDDMEGEDREWEPKWYNSTHRKCTTRLAWGLVMLLVIAYVLLCVLLQIWAKWIKYEDPHTPIWVVIGLLVTVLIAVIAIGSFLCFKPPNVRSELDL